MRKGLWKRALALGLAVMMTMGTAACGKKDEAGNANSMLAKQHVYSYEKVDFGDYGDNFSINKMEYKDGRVYALLDIYNYTGGGAVARYGAAVALPAEPVEDAVLDDEMAVEPEEEGTTDSTEEDADVDSGMTEEYVPETPTNIKRVVSFLPDGTDLQYFDLNMGEEAQNTGYSWIGSISFGAESVYAMKESYIEDFSDPENPIYENRQEIVCWGNDGVQKWALNLTDMLQTEEQYFYVSNVDCLDDGTVYVICRGDSMKLLIIDPQGNIKEEKPLGSSEMYVNSMFVRADGSILFITANDDWSKMFSSIYDPATGMMGEQVELPGNISSYSMYEGSNTDLLLTNNTGIYTFNIGDAEVTQIMNYINSDLDAMWVNYVAVIDDEHLVVTYSDIIDYQQQIAVMTKVNEEDIPDKRVLVLGANYIGTDVRRRILEYNKANEKYRITIRDYSTYNTGIDYMASYTQLNNDIIAGKMPDILMVDSQINVENYISKGFIAEIGPMIENDEELSQEEFMQNVFDAFSIDGKLYHIIPTFMVNTIVGKQSVVGDITGWNMDEFLALMDSMPEGTSSFGEYTRGSFFNLILRYCGTDFVDLETGKCNFNSPEFIKMLEFAKTLPEEIKYDEDYDWSLYETQYRENRTLLMPVTIYGIRDLNYQLYGQFGEEVTFVGFPNEDKNGSVVNLTSNSFVLSSSSEDLDGAWEFVRYYLTDEYQNTITYELPVNKEALRNLAQEATKRPYYEDENGEKVEYDDYVYINGESIVLPPMSQEQVDRIVAFIETVDRVAYYDEDILNIINEDVAPFFADQKTAEDVAEIIQNRVQVYVNAER